MKLQDLNHSLTPTALQNLNESIAAQLLLDQEKTSDYAMLRTLLAERDRLIKDHLNSLSVSEKRQFSEKELVVNRLLEELAFKLLESSKEEIIQFVRGKAAVKKYK